MQVWTNEKTREQTRKNAIKLGIWRTDGYKRIFRTRRRTWKLFSAKVSVNCVNFLISHVARFTGSETQKPEIVTQCSLGLWGVIFSAGKFCSFSKEKVGFLLCVATKIGFVWWKLSQTSELAKNSEKAIWGQQNPVIWNLVPIRDNLAVSWPANALVLDAIGTISGSRVGICSLI